MPENDRELDFKFQKSEGMEYTERSSVACLAARFPQYRDWCEMTVFEQEFSQAEVTAFTREHRIAELLDTVSKVEQGKLPPSALRKFDQQERRWH